MEMQYQAYEFYKKICEGYGMEALNFHHFIKNITETQLMEFCKNAQ